MALCAPPPPPPQLLACGLFGGGIVFTAAELAVADQLVQLSCSSCGDESSLSPSPSSSTTSSPRSVNTTTFAATTSAAEKEYEEFTAGMGDEMELDMRARKRYRLLSDLYAAKAPAAKRGGGATGCSSRKRKRDGESPEIAGGEY